jgi:hypothetical protein
MPIRSTLVLTLCLGACTPTVGKAIGYGDKSLGVLDVVITETSDLYRAAVIYAVRTCAALHPESTEASRFECLEAAGFSPDQILDVEEAIMKLRDAYDAIAEALDAMKDALPAINQAQRAAKAVQR